MWKKVTKEEYEKAKASGINTKVDYSKMRFAIRDYKTAAQKPQGITYEYRMQLHTYALILSKLGKPVSQIELEFVTRPTKTLGPRHFHFHELVTAEDLDKIESQLLTVAHSIDLWRTEPDLRWALAQDARLKPKPKPKLFKD